MLAVSISLLTCRSSLFAKVSSSWATNSLQYVLILLTSSMFQEKDLGKEWGEWTCIDAYNIFLYTSVAVK